MNHLALEQSKKRVLCRNDNNGYAFMSCVIIGKATQCVLCERDKPLQCCETTFQCCETSFHYSC